MQKTICGKVYDTAASSVVKKVTSGSFGDPAGYEETLYVTGGGQYFLYTGGGSESKYPEPSIKRMSKASADKFVAEG